MAWDRPKAQRGTFRDKASYGGSRTPAKPKKSKDQAPDGYDQNYWDLAKYFIQTCEAHEVSIRHSTFAVHDTIQRRARQAKLESGADIYDWIRYGPGPNGEPPKNRKFHQMYRDGDGNKVEWTDVALAMIDLFWKDSEVQAERGSDPLADFTQLDIFNYLHTQVVKKWETTRAVKAIRKQREEKLADPDYEPPQRGFSRRRYAEEHGND